MYPLLDPPAAIRNGLEPDWGNGTENGPYRIIGYEGESRTTTACARCGRTDYPHVCIPFFGHPVVVDESTLKGTVSIVKMTVAYSASVPSGKKQA